MSPCQSTTLEEGSQLNLNEPKDPSHTPLFLMSGSPEGQRDVSCDEAGLKNSPTPSDNSWEGKSRHNPRQLTATRALEIFKLRPHLKGPMRRGAMMQCKAIAPLFGISPKTVREIWTGRAWASATRREWTEAEIERRASSISLMIREDSAGGASNSSDTTDVLQRTTNNNAVANSLRIPALQHSLPEALGPVATPSHQHAPTLQMAPLLGLSDGAAPSLKALLAAAYAPQQAGLQQMQPAAPQAQTSSTAQLLAEFSGCHTAPPRKAWGSGAATQLVPAQDFESTLRSLQAALAQLLAKSHAQHQCQCHVLQHPQQHPQQLRQHRAIERAVAAVGRLQGPQSLVVGPPLLPSGMLPTNLSLNHLAWRPS